MNFWFFDVAMRILNKGYDVTNKTSAEFFSHISLVSGMNYLTFFIPSFLSFTLKKHFASANEAISFTMEWDLFLIAILFFICAFIRMFKDNKLKPESKQ